MRGEGGGYEQGIEGRLRGGNGLAGRDERGMWKSISLFLFVLYKLRLEA
jgi:hypothetical protein